MMNIDISRQRLLTQHIGGEKFETPEDVVRWMGAMQAQDYGQAVWAIGLRTKVPRLADVEQAIADGKILRTWPMRGTIHFVPADDAKWMVRLSAPRMIAADGRRLKQLGIDEKIVQQAMRLFQKALQGGKRLTRPAMMHLLDAAGISPKGQRGYHIIWYAAQSGQICLGPMEGKQQTFVLLDEWVPHSRELTREESLAELAGRYFASHGPATLHDFAWWAGPTIGDAKLGLEAAKSRLTSEKVDGKEYWTANDALAFTADSAASVHLLPGFDEFLLGYKDRSAVLAAEHGAKIVPGNNGIFFPVIVANGQVAGTWKRTFKKGSAEINLMPFTNLENPKVLAEVQRYGSFISLPEARAEPEEN